MVRDFFRLSLAMNTSSIAPAARHSLASRWHWSEFKACAVLAPAYKRGYGTADEIVPVHFDLATASFLRQNRLP